MNRVLALAVFVILSWSTAASAQKSSGSVTIKLKHTGDGDVTLVTQKKTGSWKVKVEDGMGNVLVDKADTVFESQAHKETVLKREGKKPASKFEREYTQFEVKEDGETVVLELQGKAVIIERKSGKYSYAYKDGKPVTGRAEEKLKQEMEGKGSSDEDLEAMMLPKTAVDVGDSWKVDMEWFAKELLNRTADGDNIVCDGAKGTGTGKLLKTYQKGGRQFGELHYHISLPVKSMGKGDAEMRFKDGATLTLDGKLDVCIDGSSVGGTARMKRSLNGTASPVQAPGSVMTISSETIEERTEAEPVKK